MPTAYPAADVLVVLTKTPADFHLAQTEGWYRIPTSTRLPANLRDGQAKTIAFYFPAAFKELKFSVRYYAAIRRVEVVERAALFPSETPNSRSGSLYHKISFGPLRERAAPLVSHRGRRLLFVPTTTAKFRQAEEINDLFHESPLEDRLWAALKARQLPAERQYHLPANGKNWVCDFAFFCAQGHIDVECDGDTYHMPPERVGYDKARNNEIAAGAGWDVLRFTTRHLLDQLPWALGLIEQQINRLGGLRDSRTGAVRYVGAPQGGQLGLFGGAG